MKKAVLISLGVLVTAVVIKNTIDIYHFTQTANEILYYLKQQEFDEVFASIIERDLHDLDDEGEN